MHFPLIRHLRLPGHPSGLTLFEVLVVTRITRNEIIQACESTVVILTIRNLLVCPATEMILFRQPTLAARSLKVTNSPISALSTPILLKGMEGIVTVFFFQFISFRRYGNIVLL